jgi:hypothetical protein
MKKIISALLLLSSTLSLAALTHVANAQVAIGSRSEEVKRIQEILKTDPTIYPEGYVTGYYGRLTENAVKKLQKKCGLPETGVIDDATEKCIYPIEYKLRVLLPNGGESWKRDEIQTIKWEVIAPSGEELKSYVFWPKASIDLFRRVKVAVLCMVCPAGQECPPCPPEREESIFVRHITTVNLFDLNYSWRITNDIPNGSDYVIRISIGEGIAPIWIQEKTKVPTVEIKTEEIWPPEPVSPKPRIDWDESDGTFEITGEITPCPVCPACPNSEEIIASLTRIIEELQKLIASLRTSR